MTTTGTVRFATRLLEDDAEPAAGVERPRAGFVPLPRAVLHASGLSLGARLTYAMLLSYAWQAGSCFPSAERLKADLGCGINQVSTYLRELEGVGLISRRRRGLGQTTVYTLHDQAEPPRAPVDAPADELLSRDAQPVQTHRISDSGLTETVKAEPPIRRHKLETTEYHSREHQHPEAPTPPTGVALTDAVDDALLASLEGHGVTERIAVRLVQTHDAQAVQEQLDWHPYRPAAKNPAGSLVQAIRERWPAPPAWLEAQEHAATVARQAEAAAARQAEDETRRQEWEARSPEKRIVGRLTFWVEGRRRKRQEPTPAEVEAKREELLAQIVTEAPPLV